MMPIAASHHAVDVQLSPVTHGPAHAQPPRPAVVPFPLGGSRDDGKLVILRGTSSLRPPVGELGVISPMQTE